MSDSVKRKASTELIPGEIEDEKSDSNIIVEQPPSDAFNQVYTANDVQTPQQAQPNSIFI